MLVIIIINVDIVDYVNSFDLFFGIFVNFVEKIDNGDKSLVKEFV